MKVLKFNIYCNTAKEAIAEINALMSEYKEKLLEFNVNIMLDEQKESIDLTIDSNDIKDKFNLLYCQDDRKKHRLSGRQI